MRIMGIIFLLIGFATQAVADPLPANAPPPPPDAKVVSAADRILTDSEFTISIAVLAFGLVAFLIQSRLLRRSAIRQQEVLKMTTVTLVIVGTLFVITAGFDSEQIAPAMGLFGTICGYLLGQKVQTENVK